MPALLAGGSKARGPMYIQSPKKCGYTSSYNITQGVRWLLKNQHEVTRAGLAAKTTNHKPPATPKERLAVSRPVAMGLVDGSTRRAVGRSPAARSRIDARRYLCSGGRGGRPDVPTTDELRAALRAQLRVRRPHGAGEGGEVRRGGRGLLGGGCNGVPSDFSSSAESQTQKASHHPQPASSAAFYPRYGV
jgi:hypothetical protein